MIAQFLFTALLLAICLTTLAQLRQIPLVATTVLCAALFGGYLVWMPEHATVIAHWIGIGRGTDLILYVWVLISSGILLILYLRVRAQLGIITVLVRAIALLEARGIQQGLVSVTVSSLTRYSMIKGGIHAFTRSLGDTSD